MTKLAALPSVNQVSPWDSGLPLSPPLRIGVTQAGAGAELGQLLVASRGRRAGGPGVELWLLGSPQSPSSPRLSWEGGTWALGSL